MLKIIFILLWTFSQVSNAGQLYEVDVTNCPSELKIYNGDTVRFINTSSKNQIIGVSSAFFYYGVIPGDYFDYKFTPSPYNPLVMPDVKINYACDGTQGILKVGASPIAIHPKQFIDDADSALNFNIYILDSNTQGWDESVKSIAIIYNGNTVFSGDFKAYQAFIKSLGSIVVKESGVNFNCSGNTVGAPTTCTPQTKGYMFTQFRIEARFVGIFSTLRVKLTMATPKGDVEYEDQAYSYRQGS